ncbi:transcriptional activator of glycolytic enzymes-domain-containing protein [Choanephora cucurbitarum]|nr:transcriptional activator of glycolytic enzymes-domain-containing protein [Choanephora cucurbitarum]
MRLRSSRRHSPQTFEELSSITDRVAYSQQKDFKEWCRVKNFDDGDLIYEEKLRDFLIDYVFKRKKRIVTAMSKHQPYLGEDAIGRYVFSIVQLHKQQMAQNINSYDNPNGPLVKEAIQEHLDKNPNLRKGFRLRYQEKGKKASSSTASSRNDRHRRRTLNRNEPCIKQFMKLKSEMEAGINTLSSLIQAEEEDDYQLHIEKIRQTLMNMLDSSNMYLNSSAETAAAASLISPTPSLENLTNVSSLSLHDLVDLPDICTKKSPPKQSPDRSIRSVSDAWREYSIGINGGLPLKYLEENFGMSWLKRDTPMNDYCFYERRKHLINLIKRIAKNENVSQEEVAERLEMERRARKVRLDKLSTILIDEGL